MTNLCHFTDPASARSYSSYAGAAANGYCFNNAANWTSMQTAMFFMLLGVSLIVPTCTFGEDVNYDEAKVPDYKLPELLICEDGSSVDDVKTWESKRRPELMRLFKEQVYGRTPEAAARFKAKRFDVSETVEALDGKVVRKLVTIYLTESADSPKIELLIYMPKDAKWPVPTFIGHNFQGNHTIANDPGVPVTESWVRTRSGGESTNRATEKTRGAAASRWPVEMITDRGYAVATCYYGDIDPDFDDDFQNGVHPLFNREGLAKPDAEQWGSIGAWSWGLSRVMDYFETDADIDQQRVAVLGHSRLGKTSLWAGASDPRFAVVISNDSGCGGAALHRRAFGEKVGRINRSFPHWFCDNFTQYNENEAECPVDQHMLIALMAPRPVYVASAKEDRWADPHGEFLSAMHADPTYRLYGLEGMDATEMPEVDHPVGKTIGYHMRTGGHDVKDYDWQQYLDFTDRHLSE